MDPTITTTPTRSSASASASASDVWVPPPPNPHDEPPLQLPPVPGGGKLRLMCSYGGHIVPRPHDKSLCYVGGDTRIVVVDRNSSLSSLCNRLSSTLLQASSQRRSFTLKYQLPTEDLDSLISLTTDEDLDNMIEEYDRTAAAAKPSRLRLFLFLSKPETASSMGALLDDAKSETWFVDALNGSGLLPRGLSDSAAEDCLLLGLRDGEAQGDFNKQAATAVVVENSSSSFGSSSSSPSMSNLPQIRVRMAADEELKPTVPGAATIEEQFAQMTYVTTAAASAVTAASDDEKSDHGGGASAPVGFRKPPLPLQPVQQKGGSGGSGGGGGNGGGYGLPSPDSVASDTSSSSLSKPVYYQDQPQHYAPPPQPRAEASDPVPSGTHIVQQPKDGGGSYVLQPHLDQYHHYVPAQISPYYQIYPQNHQQQQYHHHMDHQYPQPGPLYVVPAAAAGSRPPATASSGIPPAYPAKPAPATQYIGYSHHPSQSVSGAHNYAYEYSSNTVPSEHHHVYYAAAPPSQYQSITPAAAYALSEAAKQLPSDTSNAHPQTTNSQPQ